MEGCLVLGNFPKSLGLGIFGFGLAWDFLVSGFGLVFDVWCFGFTSRKYPKPPIFLWVFSVGKWDVFLFNMTFLERVMFQA